MVAKPSEPGTDAIPAEEVLGREEPDGPAESHDPISTVDATDAGGLQATTSKANARAWRRGDRVLLVGLVAAVVVGGALYLSWHDIEVWYERRFHPARYWAAEVRSLRFDARLAELRHQECMVDLVAARTKEPLRATRGKLLGLSESQARSAASEETSTQAEVCKLFENSAAADRERLANAERELSGVR